MDPIDIFIEQGLKEDVGPGDFTSEACIPNDARNQAVLLVKSEGIIAGVAIAERIFRKLDPSCTFEASLRDGDIMQPGMTAFRINANARALLQGERLALNTMQRMSGIASLSHTFAKRVVDLPVKILDTRKTTPLIRFIEKWAVRLGGCHNYRDGLYDWFMIKDNHIDACGSIRSAIERVVTFQKVNDLKLSITIEVRNLKELEEVLQTGNITRIMLDNFDLPELEEAVRRVAGRFETEASGGINLEKLRPVAETGVDFISVGALTHSAVSKDLSLKIRL